MKSSSLFVYSYGVLNYTIKSYQWRNGWIWIIQTIYISWLMSTYIHLMLRVWESCEWHNNSFTTSTCLTFHSQCYEKWKIPFAIHLCLFAIWLKDVKYSIAHQKNYIWRFFWRILYVFAESTFYWVNSFQPPWQKKK